MNWNRVRSQDLDRSRRAEDQARAARLLEATLKTFDYKRQRKIAQAAQTASKPETPPSS